MQSSLEAQSRAMQEQQSAMMESLGQQLALMRLPPEQEQAFIKQYQDAFKLQDQQLSQQAELVNAGTSPARTILVRLSFEMPVFPQYFAPFCRLMLDFRMFRI